VTTIRTWVRIVALLTLPAAHVPPPVFADQGKGTIDTSVMAGTSLPITLFRAHRERRLTMAAFQLGRVMTNERGEGALAGTFELLLEISPLASVHQPQNAFGFTASPLHMRWNFGGAAPRPVRVFAEASGGIILTNVPVPARTTTLNFIDQAGFGLRLGRGARRTWLLGYRFQHISNAGRVQPNPGVNFNFVYAGVSFLRP
jgi:Lipid A 3-O-deacylase (PagL)